MKRKSVSVCCALLTLFIFSFISFSGIIQARSSNRSYRHSDSIADAVFPSSLKIISDEAFSGTSFHSVYFDTQLVHIGAKAFSNNNCLREVFVPKNVIFIGNGAFPTFVAIHGIKGSQIHEWAKDNGNVFIEDYQCNLLISLNTVNIKIAVVYLCIISCKDSKVLLRIWIRIWGALRNMCPKERAELYPIDYRFP